METKAVAVPFQGTEFFMKVADGEMINLTDLWKGAGMPKVQAPYEWLRLPSTIKIIKTLQEDPKHGKSRDLLKKVRGRNGGTYAHWRLGVQYAAYLSPVLQSFLVDLFRERVQETIDPDLAYSRGKERATKTWLVMGKPPDWIMKRIKGIDARNDLTSHEGKHGVEGSGYAKCTNAMYVKMFHGTAKEIRTQRNLPERANLRDNLSTIELSALELAEAIAKRNITTVDAWGTEECAAETARAGHAVKVALTMCEVEPRRRIG